MQSMPQGVRCDCLRRAMILFKVVYMLMARYRARDISLTSVLSSPCRAISRKLPLARCRLRGSLHLRAGAEARSLPDAYIDGGGLSKLQSPIAESHDYRAHAGDWQDEGDWSFIFV